MKLYMKVAIPLATITALAIGAMSLPQESTEMRLQVSGEVAEAPAETTTDTQAPAPTPAPETTDETTAPTPTAEPAPTTSQAPAPAPAPSPTTTTTAARTVEHRLDNHEARISVIEATTTTTTQAQAPAPQVPTPPTTVTTRPTRAPQPVTTQPPPQPSCSVTVGRYGPSGLEVSIRSTTMRNVHVAGNIESDGITNDYDVLLDSQGNGLFRFNEPNRSWNISIRLDGQTICSTTWTP